MDLIATGALSGHEARATVRVLAENDATIIELADLWVAPGAPDVRLFASSAADGTIDATSTELGPVPYGSPVHRTRFPGLLGVDDARSIVIYCHIYSVLFGYAELDWVLR